MDKNILPEIGDRVLYWAGALREFGVYVSGGASHESLDFSSTQVESQHSDVVKKTFREPC